MPPRDPSLPEGTDHIIDTNIDIDGGGNGSGGGGSVGGTTGSGGSGTSGSSAFQFDKDGSGDGSKGSGIAGQVREQISKLTDQAGERARGFADDGKKQATDFLQTIAKVVSDAAGSVEERLGSQYAGFGNRASESINSLASSLDERSVDDLIDDARSFVKRSPVVAIGVAALVGFAVARVVRSSISEFSNSGDEGRTSGGTSGNAAMGSAGTSGGSAA